MNIPQSTADCQKSDLLIPNWENHDPKQQDRIVLNKWFTTELYTKEQIPGECEALIRRERKSVLFQITVRIVPVQLYHSYFIAGCTDEMFPLSFRKAKSDLSVPAWDISIARSTAWCRRAQKALHWMIQGKKGEKMLSNSDMSHYREMLPFIHPRIQIS